MTYVKIVTLPTSRSLVEIKTWNCVVLHFEVGKEVTCDTCEVEVRSPLCLRNLIQWGRGSVMSYSISNKWLFLMS